MVHICSLDRPQHDSDGEQGQAFYVGGAEQGGGGQQVKKLVYSFSNFVSMWFVRFLFPINLNILLGTS